MKQRRYRVGIDLDWYNKIFIRGCIISLLLGVILTLILSGLIFNAIRGNLIDHYETIITGYKTQLQENNARHSSQLTYLEKQHDAEISEYENACSELEAQITTLNETISSRDETIEAYQQEAQADFNTISKYWYVLRDAPSNSGITIDHIRFADKVGRERNVNPHLMWAIYEVESGWRSKCDSSSGSSARGLGQVLESTARRIWEVGLGHGKGTYNHSMAYDPYVNIEITTYYIGENLAQNSMRDTIAIYRGKDIQSYYDAVIASGRQHGITLTEDTARYCE